MMAIAAGAAMLVGAAIGSVWFVALYIYAHAHDHRSDEREPW